MPTETARSISGLIDPDAAPGTPRAADAARAAMEVDSSPGARLRRLARAAIRDNAWSRPPMKPPPPWQPSTAYVARQVVCHGGNLFAAATAGTSGTTGPTNVTSSGATEGSVIWIYFGTPAVTEDPTAPLASWAATTAYTLGAKVRAGNGVYACTTAGTSGSTSPTSTGIGIADGTVVWSYQGPYLVNRMAGEVPTYTANTVAPSGLTNLHDGRLALSPVGLLGATPIAGGSGYAVGDTITLSGGTSTIAAVVRVASVSGGAVTGVSVLTAGSYTALPAGASLAVAQASSSGSGTGATFATRWPDPPWCKLRGCYNAGAYFSGGVRLATFSAAAPATPVAQHCGVEFWSDAPKLYFETFSNGTPYSILVDGVRLSLDPTPPASASIQYNTLDFSAAGGRRPRLYRLETTIGGQFGRIAVDTSSQVWTPDDGDAVTAAFLSDSVMAGSGYGPFVIGNTVPQRVGHLLGWSSCWAFAQGGTGYLNRGSAPGVTTDKYGARVAEALTRNPDVWVLMGSTNDPGSGTTAQVTAAVTVLLQSIRSGGSTAPIVVLGIWPVDDTALASGSKYADYEAAILAGVTASADVIGRTYFIPIRNDAALPWITGAWNNTANPSSTNKNAYVGGDNIHPPDPGTAYLASRIASAIREQVLPTIN